MTQTSVKIFSGTIVLCLLLFVYLIFVPAIIVQWVAMVFGHPLPYLLNCLHDSDTSLILSYLHLRRLIGDLTHVVWWMGHYSGCYVGYMIPVVYGSPRYYERPDSDTCLIYRIYILWNDRDLTHVVWWMSCDNGHYAGHMLGDFKHWFVRQRHTVWSMN